MDSFFQAKKDALSRKDKSFIGNIDGKIKNLCEKINSLEDYFTTSSCSGRIVLMLDEDKKASGLFLKVWHEKINFEELKKELERISLHQHPDRPPLKCAHFVRNINSDSSNKKNFDSCPIIKPFDKISKKDNNLNIKFKQEPVIVHAACRNFDDAKIFLAKAQRAGFKRSGIIASGKKFVVECISTEKLEFPIISDGELLVGDKFLKIIAEKSNENLEKGWKKIGKLEKSLISNFL